jgi:hypothetical protein
MTRVKVVCAVVAALAVCCAGAFASRTTLTGARIAATRLPPGVAFDSVEPFGAQLLLSGLATAGSRCVWATVDPETLRITSSVSGDCERPLRSAHPYVPVEFQRSVGGLSGRSSFVRIAHVATTGTLSFGPKVMTFQDGSDSHPQWVYGGRWLWLFDQASTNGPEILRLSAAAGEAKQVVRVPKVVYRPLPAANADGLWIVDPTGSAEPSPVFHLSPGSRAPVLVRRAGVGALWLAASGHAAWVDTLVSVEKRGLGVEQIWRFDGSAPRGRQLARADGLDSEAAVPDGAGGLWTVDPVPAVPGDFATCNSERVVRIDQRSGAQKLIATVPTSDEECAVLPITPASATFDRAFFFLSRKYGRQLLVRVRPG